MKQSFEQRLARLEQASAPREHVCCLVLYATHALVRCWSGRTVRLSLADAQPYLADAVVKVYAATAEFDPDVV